MIYIPPNLDAIRIRAREKKETIPEIIGWAIQNLTYNARDKSNDLEQIAADFDEIAAFVQVFREYKKEVKK